MTSTKPNRLSQSDKKEEQDPRAAPSGNKVPTARYSAAELFGDRTEIEIEHNGAIYRLRLTKLGKLVLNK